MIQSDSFFLSDFLSKVIISLTLIDIFFQRNLFSSRTQLNFSHAKIFTYIVWFITIIIWSFFFSYFKFLFYLIRAQWYRRIRWCCRYVIRIRSAHDAILIIRYRWRKNGRKQINVDNEVIYICIFIYLFICICICMRVCIYV